MLFCLQSGVGVTSAGTSLAVFGLIPPFLASFSSHCPVFLVTVLKNCAFATTAGRCCAARRQTAAARARGEGCLVHDDALLFSLGRKMGSRTHWGRRPAQTSSNHGNVNTCTKPTLEVAEKQTYCCFMHFNLLFHQKRESERGFFAVDLCVRQTQTRDVTIGRTTFLKTRTLHDPKQVEADIPAALSVNQ